MKLADWIRRLGLRVDVSGSAWPWIVAWAVFLLVAASVVWINFPYWLSDNKSGSTTIRNIFLVVAALIARPLAVWRSKVAERQANAAQKKSQIAQVGPLNERYQKGAEMLGSDVLSVRVGAYYPVTLSAASSRAD